MITTPSREELESAAAAAAAAERTASDAPVDIVAAHCEYSLRGDRLAHWYRMVWRGGQWQYFGPQLEPVGRLAANRYQVVTGKAWLGEIVAEHGLDGPITHVGLVVSREKPKVTWLEWHRTPDGQLRITLPSVMITRPDPRRCRP